MKKIFTCVLAICFAVPMFSERIVTENFEYQLGGLKGQGDWVAKGTQTSNPIQVVNSPLTYLGYMDKAIGYAAQIEDKSTSDEDLYRPFPDSKKIDSGTAYMSALFKVTKNIVTENPTYFLAMTKSSTGEYCKLFVLKGSSESTYKIGITKSVTTATRVAYCSQELTVGTTYLCVLGYTWKDDTSDDVASLWINPTNFTTQPTADATESYSTDASQLDGFELQQRCTYNATCPVVTVDGIHVATAWADLFDGGGTTTALSVSPETISGGYIFQGDNKTYTIRVTGQLLTEGVSISHTNKEVTLSTGTIAKAAAEEGVDITATLKANAVGEQKDTLVFTSGELVKKIPMAWNTIGVVNCASVKALKDSVNGLEGYSIYVRLTGEAVVTRDTTISGVRELYVQDATGAAKLTDEYEMLAATNLEGAKIKDMLFINGEAGFGVQPFIAQGTPTVVSTGNKVEPQVVTLAELQANAADYLLELVQVQKVTFAKAGETFASGQWAISQDDKTANVKVEMSTGITGHAVPEKANVTGFSLNTSGSVIVPRDMNDIVDANPVLLVDGGFENFETKPQGPFGTITTYKDWTISGVSGISTEATDIKEGKNAFRTTSDLSMNTNMYQSVDMTSFAEGETFQLTLWYKVLNSKGDDLTLNCYWSEYSGITDPSQSIDHDTDKLQTVLPKGEGWTKYSIQTTKPAKGNRFEFNLKLLKKAEVLLDSFCLEPVESTEPWFAVVPEKESYDVSAAINTEKTVATLTIKQKNLTQPVLLEISGTGKDQFAINKTQATAAEETVVVTYKPTKVGKCSAVLNIIDDECQATTLLNKAIGLYGSCYDPSKPVQLTLVEPEKKTFSCKAEEKDSTTFKVSSENAVDWVHVVIESTQQVQADGGFSLDGSFFSKNEEHTIKLFFKPMFEGDYAATVKAYTEGFTDTLKFNVTGHADKGGDKPIVVDYDTVFTWNMENPYKLLDEGFDMGTDLRNKTLKVTDWHNVVTKGSRAWQGFDSDTTKVAKASSYKMGYTIPEDMEAWLVTPALDYLNAETKVFTFKVMSDILFEGQEHKLEVYYIDATDPKNPLFQHLSDVDPLIPANDGELEYTWYPIQVGLANQPIADVFFMAFKFTGKAYNNGGNYFLDDVTWGKEEIITDDAQHKANELIPVKMLIRNQFIIFKNGIRYNLFGQEK
ncbi:MAG: hypothetical protein MJZ64_02190 [Paludibacteraceae bacterium]|nr:hypothetical protein [Paludibacteraceae bacterium]